MRFQVAGRFAAALGLYVSMSCAADAQSAWETQSPVSPAASVSARYTWASWDAQDATRAAALKWELGYLGLSAVDAAETISCLRHDVCVEGNPVFGKHPSSTKLIAAKVGLGLIHFAVFERANDRNPRAALRLAQISCVVQGGVVGLNARFAFH